MWRLDFFLSFLAYSLRLLDSDLSGIQESSFSMLSPPWPLLVCIVLLQEAEIKFWFIHIHIYVQYTLHGKKTLMVTTGGKAALCYLFPFVSYGPSHSGPQSQLSHCSFLLSQVPVSLEFLKKIPPYSVPSLGLFVPFSSGDCYSKVIASLL